MRWGLGGCGVKGVARLNAGSLKAAVCPRRPFDLGGGSPEITAWPETAVLHRRGCPKGQSDLGRRMAGAGLLTAPSAGLSGHVECRCRLRSAFPGNAEIDSSLSLIFSKSLRKDSLLYRHVYRRLKCCSKPIEGIESVEDTYFFSLDMFGMVVKAMFGWLWRREFPDGRGRVSRTVTRLEGNHGKGKQKFTVGKGVRQAAGAAIVSP